MLRLELEASRGNWYAAWFFLFSLSLPSPRLVWQGPAEPLTGLLGKKEKSSRSLILRGDLFCPETKGHKASQKESLPWWPAFNSEPLREICQTRFESEAEQPETWLPFLPTRQGGA